MVEVFFGLIFITTLGCHAELVSASPTTTSALETLK